MTLASGVDHLIYGWVFFGIVIFLLFWLGTWFREDVAPGAAPVAAVNPPSRLDWPRLLTAAILALLLAAAGPWLAGRIAPADPGVAAGAIALPAAPPGWQELADAPWTWQPPSRVSGVERAFYQRDGQQVGVVLQYDDGSMGSVEVIGSSRYFSVYRSRWEQIGSDRVGLPHGGEELLVDEGRIRGPEGTFVVWSWYLVGDLQTSNDYIAKFRQAAGRLGWLSSGEWRILLVTPADEDPSAARRTLTSFWTARGDALIRSLQDAGEGSGP